MNRTKIEWVLNPDGTQGYTWNPLTGCLNHVDGMCKGGGFPCYAYRLANGRLKPLYLTNKNTATQNYDEDSYPFYPRFWMERIEKADKFLKKLRDPIGVFTCDMGDLFGLGIPESWTEWVLEIARRYPQHRFYLLTKQPQNLLQWSPFPDNCWVGVTATNNTSLDKAMVGLAGIVASKRYISFEPLLLPVNFSEEDAELLDWVIIGAQTRPAVYPKIEWVEEIVSACDKAGVAVFLKNNLKPMFTDVISGQYALDRGFCNWGGELRQELPK